MFQRIRRRPSIATVVALVAMFVALGGPAEAARLIGGAQIRDRSITSRDVNRGTIRFLRTTPARSVRTAQIVDGQVLTRDLAARAVTAAQIADGAIGSAHLAPGAVTASRLAAGSVSGATIADGTLQTVDIGQFAGSVQVSPDFPVFNAGDCQETVTTPVATTQPQPNIADDVVIVTPPVGWPAQLTVTGLPGAGNLLRIVVCNVSAANGIAAPSPTVFRYVTIDTP